MMHPSTAVRAQAPFPAVANLPFAMAASSSSGYTGPAPAGASGLRPGLSSSSSSDEDAGFEIVGCAMDFDGADDPTLLPELARTWRKWRYFVANAMIVAASKAQWGQLGNWLKNFPWRHPQKKKALTAKAKKKEEPK